MALSTPIAGHQKNLRFAGNLAGKRNATPACQTQHRSTQSEHTSTVKFLLRQITVHMHGE